MQSKRCRKCGVDKPVSGFHRDRNGSGGLRSDCKECRRAYSEAHREEQCAYARAYYELHREELLAYKRAYWEDHREECHAQLRKRQTKARKASREVATRNGEPWTPAEDHVVLTSEGTELEIAIELGRTTSSINNRRRLLRRKAVTA